MLKVAVVGAGSIGREFALRHLVETSGVTVVAIVDSNLELASSLAYDVTCRIAGAEVVGSKYRETVDKDFLLDPNANVVISSVDLASVLPLVDMCYIGTPPSTHAGLAIMSLEAGKHVLLEKPIAVSTQDTENIVVAAQKAWVDHKSVVNVNIGMRFCAAAVEMKRLLAEEKIGTVQSMELRLLFRQWPREWQTQPWVAGRQQGGPLLEVGTHYVFGLLEIVGHDAVERVDCTSVYPDDGTADDGRSLCETACTGSITLHSGVQVLVDVCTDSAEAHQKGADIYELWVRGSEGSLVLYDFTRLRDGCSNEDLLVGGYGRQECVTELVQAVRTGQIEGTQLVTPVQAQCVQRVIAAMRGAA